MITFDEAYQYIISSYYCGKKREQADLLGILHLIGGPHKTTGKFIHVAGTNGKGSVCVMLMSVLNAAGYSVGLYTSPHLHKFNERFIIDGKPISDGELAKHIGIAKDAENKYFGNTGERLSYFQLLTICAFSYFDEKRPDFIIFETGIGGRLDATNVIESPIVSVITKIGLDHTEILGNTTVCIAEEKAGVIKKNCKAVLYFQCEEVYNVIKEKCSALNSRLYYAHELDIQESPFGLEADEFCVNCEYYSYDGLKLGLKGVHQPFNASTALLAIAALRDYGVKIPRAAVYSGLESVSWAGRMEILNGQPLAVLDGAHNADGIYSLSCSLKKYFYGRNITLVFAVLQDKQYEEMVSIITDNPDVKNIVLTQPVYNKRAVTPKEIEKFVPGGLKRHIEQDYKKAIELAYSITRPDGVICCCGSLYLVGDIRAVLNQTRNGQCLK